MTNITNPYDALYTSLKNRFTVIHDGCECTLGDYMLMRAGKRQTSESSLPVQSTVGHNGTLSTIATYIGNKLSVRNAPEKNKTIRRFPLRASMSAVLSAVAACALVFSFGIFALTGGPTITPYASSTSETQEYTPEYETDITEDAVDIEE